MVCRGQLVVKILKESKRTMAIDIGGMRKPYLSAKDAFDIKDLIAKEPYSQFHHWFEQAKETPGIEEANAMCLATATKSGLPSSRMLLLKAFGPPSDTDKGGFVFFTNFESRKGKELEENPNAALMFYWEPLKRSIRIEGTVEKISEEASVEYFSSRPFGSQIGAAISHQSQVVPNREYLSEKESQLKKEYEGCEKKLSKPDFWGGYRVLPHTFEFWQGQSTRIHDRLRFRLPAQGETGDDSLAMKGDNGWLIERLSP